MIEILDFIDDNQDQNGNILPETEAFAEEVITSEVNFKNDNLGVQVFEQDYKSQMSSTELIIFEDLSRDKQLDYLHSAYLAFLYAEFYYENIPQVQYNGKGDAYRHALWNALGAAKLGSATMEQLTSAHEEKPFTYPYHYMEKDMDLYNNNIGINLGNQSNFLLMIKVKTKLENGELVYLSDTNPQATQNSQLIPTNQ